MTDHPTGLLRPFQESASDTPERLPPRLSCGKARPAISFAPANCRKIQHSTKNLKRRLAEHAAGRGARLLAVVAAAGIGWELARVWPGGRARERQLKRMGGHARLCPLCGITPRALPRNRDGSVSRSLTTDAQKLAAGLMTAAQLAEHTALRHGAVTGKAARAVRRGPLADDPWMLPRPSAGVTR